MARGWVRPTVPPSPPAPAPATAADVTDDDAPPPKAARPIFLLLVIHVLILEHAHCVREAPVRLRIEGLEHA